jgi:hypothetical protein
MMISYALFFWVLVQTCDVTFPLLGIPDWVMQTIVLVGLASMPVALAGGWCVGLVRDRYQGAEAEPAADSDPCSRISFGLLVGLVTGACVLALLVLVQARGDALETADRGREAQAVCSVAGCAKAGPGGTGRTRLPAAERAPAAGHTA